MTTHAPPTVTARLLAGATAWRLVIVCPYCGGEHEHGGGPLDALPAAGHRVAHCGHPGGYTILPLLRLVPPSGEAA